MWDMSIDQRPTVCLVNHIPTTQQVLNAYPNPSDLDCQWKWPSLQQKKALEEKSCLKKRSKEREIKMVLQEQEQQQPQQKVFASKVPWVFPRFLFNPIYSDTPTKGQKRKRTIRLHAGGELQKQSQSQPRPKLQPQPQPQPQPPPQLQLQSQQEKIIVGYETQEPLLSISESISVYKELIETLGSEYLSRPQPKILGVRQASARHVALIGRARSAEKVSSLEEAKISYSYRHLPAEEHPIINLDLFPQMKQFVIHRAEQLFGRSFSLVHVSLYTEHGDKMGLHNDVDQTVGDYVVNVSLLAPRTFLLGGTKVETRCGYAILFQKSVHHGLKSIQKDQLRYQTLPNDLLLPRVSLSLREGALGGSPKQQFLSSLPPVMPLRVRIGPHPKIAAREQGPRLLAGHSANIPVGTVFRDRLSLNLSRVLVAMQGSGDFKNSRVFGAATAIMADVRHAKDRSTLYCNVPVYHDNDEDKKTRREPPDVLLYAAQRTGVPMEEVNLTQTPIGSLMFNQILSKSVDTSLVRALALHSPVRVIARTSMEGSHSADPKVVYIYWGIYFVSEVIGATKENSNIEFRYFVLERIPNSEVYLADHEIGCLCPSCKSETPKKQQDLGIDLGAESNLQSIRKPSGMELVQKYYYSTTPGIRLRLIVQYQHPLDPSLLELETPMKKRRKITKTGAQSNEILSKKEESVCRTLLELHRRALHERPQCKQSQNQQSQHQQSQHQQPQKQQPQKQQLQKQQSQHQQSQKQQSQHQQSQHQQPQKQQSQHQQSQHQQSQKQQLQKQQSQHQQPQKQQPQKQQPQKQQLQKQQSQHQQSQKQQPQKQQLQKQSQHQQSQNQQRPHPQTPAQVPNGSRESGKSNDKLSQNPFQQSRLSHQTPRRKPHPKHSTPTSTISQGLRELVFVDLPQHQRQPPTSMPASNANHHHQRQPQHSSQHQQHPSQQHQHSFPHQQRPSQHQRPSQQHQRSFQHQQRATQQQRPSQQHQSHRQEKQKHQFL